MWMAKLNLKSLENNPKNTQKQPTENQRNAKNRNICRRPVFHLACQGGNTLLCPQSFTPLAMIYR